MNGNRSGDAYYAWVDNLKFTLWWRSGRSAAPKPGRSAAEPRCEIKTPEIRRRLRIGVFP